MKTSNLRPGFIVNLTQHVFSADQLAELQQAGVEVIDLDTTHIRAQISFDELPAREEITQRARDLARWAWTQVEALESESKVDLRRPIYAMIGGAPFFMGPLEKALGACDMAPCYAFSKRVAVEDPETGTKTSVFKHEGFVVV